MNQRLVANLYLIFLLIGGYVYSTDVVDIVGIQWYYLSYLNILFFIIVIYNKIKKRENQQELFFLKNPVNLLYFIYFLFCCFSLIFSINLSVSIIGLSKIFISLTSLFIIHELKIYNYIKINHLALIFSLGLLIEVFMSLKGYFSLIEVTDFKFKMAEVYLKGLSGNKNITAASIAFKLPFLYYFIFKTRNKYLKALLLFASAVVYFNLFLLSSRAIFLSLFLCFIFFLIASIISMYLSKSNLKLFFQRIGIYILPILASGLYFYSSVSDENIKVENRISTISTNDTSASTRLRYYEKGITYFTENPIFGAGIGNFQIVSIKLDSQNIESYIVPYVAHNDFIELLTEIGFFGTFIYLIFIISPFLFLIKVFLNSKDHIVQNVSIILTLPFIIYFVDSNLNFPQYRPEMQVSLLIYLTAIYFFYKKEILQKI